MKPEEANAACQALKSMQDRSKRISEIGEPRFSTHQIRDLCNEAQGAFIYGCFRSSIFISSLTAEQALKHAIIFSSDDWKKNWATHAHNGFKNSIDTAKKLKFNSTVLENTDWLRRVRNAISAHPSYVGNIFDWKKGGEKSGEITNLRDEAEFVWANELMHSEIVELLKCVEPEEKRVGFEQTMVTAEFTSGKVVQLPLITWLEKYQFDLTNCALWFSLKGLFLEAIAMESYRRMVWVLNDLFVERKIADFEQPANASYY